jgi:hypothetical protein
MPDVVPILSPLHWVRLSAYCQQSGDTPAAVHSRRRRVVVQGDDGSSVTEWIDGLHCQIAPDGNLWVNLLEVNRWVEGKNSRQEVR